jgi:hypothetical protein
MTMPCARSSRHQGVVEERVLLVDQLRMGLGRHRPVRAARRRSCRAGARRLQESAKRTSKNSSRLDETMVT